MNVHNYSCQIVIQIEFYGHIKEKKNANIEFLERPSSKSRVQCRRTGKT
jgi:hypothetical protein